MEIADRVSGCFFGLAIGDAFAARTEFISSVEQIYLKYPPDGPHDLEGSPSRVTDDTQMTLAVARALLNAPRPFSPAGLEMTLRHEFVKWLLDPENNRAPGLTCLDACQNLKKGLIWQQATVAHSKGCGANMRVAPVGWMPAGKFGIDSSSRAAIAQFQAALTHGHPTGLAASDLTAATITYLLEGGKPAELVSWLKEYSHSQRLVYHTDWLGSLWDRSTFSNPQNYIAKGWDDCLGVLSRLEKALLRQDYKTDPCQQTGAGWIAEEALATALLCFLLYPDDAVSAIRRAAITSGDSDSIACLTGAFAGAYLGAKAFPQNWLDRIEYRETILELSEGFTKLFA
ncbi:MAG: ADP-ribosylglycohydrolase family protein [Chloroflexi bacterium]|uniref:ADP-ribosylglycohydrolase family protein n=1 Tax=Candidatus Chlorohelix allophototropha TaxID=3003348 RepID=A0A8T7M082_9CHLR|nr:ADP-ribosylglycohydrolase family protein [Chloroflexota bacterium]WJW67049.1 ADP-ribosylglycohydrolase family protein [Chloroflexota bacterium L227-S17]